MVNLRARDIGRHISMRRGVFKKHTRAAGLIEYGMIVGLIAVLSIAAVLSTGEEVERYLNEAADALSAGAGDRQEPSISAIVSFSANTAGGYFSPTVAGLTIGANYVYMGETSTGLIADAPNAQAIMDELCVFMNLGESASTFDTARFGEMPGFGSSVPSHGYRYDGTQWRVVGSSVSGSSASTHLLTAISCAGDEPYPEPQPNGNGQYVFDGEGARYSPAAQGVYPMAEAIMVGGTTNGGAEYGPWQEFTQAAMDQLCEYLRAGDTAVSYDFILDTTALPGPRMDYGPSNDTAWRYVSSSTAGGFQVQYIESLTCE